METKQIFSTSQHDVTLKTQQQHISLKYQLVNSSIFCQVNISWVTALFSAKKLLVSLFMVTHMHASSGVVADDRAIRDGVQVSDITSATSSQLGHFAACTHTKRDIRQVLKDLSPDVN